MQSEKNNSLIYFTPAEIGSQLVVYSQNKSVGSGMLWGTPRLNQRILPLDKGNIGVIAALPGGGKTSLAVALARDYAKSLLSKGEKNRAVLYVTCDQTVEDIACMAVADKEHTVTAFAEGRVPQKDAERLAREFVNLPFYISGKSVVDPRPQQPRLTFANIEKGIYEMEKHVHAIPALICIDYIQNMPIEKMGKERVAQVYEAMVGARELALSIPCPVLVLVQAARTSKDREIKIPIPQESQWSSSVEQEADVWLGIWRPQVTELDKTTVKFAGKQVPITENLLFVGLMKQRRKPAGYTFITSLDGGSLEFRDVDVTHEGGW